MTHCGPACGGEERVDEREREDKEMKEKEKERSGE